MVIKEQSMSEKYKIMRKVRIYLLDASGVSLLDTPDTKDENN